MANVCTLAFVILYKRYIWSVGTSPNATDVIEAKIFEHTVVGACEEIKLNQSASYYSTLQAYNKGLNSMSTSKVSSGGLISLIFYSKTFLYKHYLIYLIL